MRVGGEPEVGDRGQDQDRALRVVVVGGGISGLSTAYYLQEAARKQGLPLSCTLVEGASRLGGKVVTDSQDGFVVEGGPDSFLTQKPWAVELCRKLDLGEQLIGTNEASRKVYVLWKGKLHKLPDGVLLIVPTRLQPFVLSPLFSPLAKLRMGLDLVIPARRDSGDESVASFVRRRLGSEALDKIAEPMMGGVHVSDPESQSLLATFPRFADIERKHGSLIRGMLAGRRHRPPTTGKPLPTFMTLVGGLGTLISTLVEKLDGCQILTAATVTSLGASADGYRLRLGDGTELQADAVVLATPARDAARLLDPVDSTLAERLRSIRYVSTATVSLGYRRDTFPHPLDGFGVVIPSKEARRITACTWTSTKFDGRAPTDGVLVRCFLGSPRDDREARLPDDEIIRVAREEMRELMGVGVEPVLTRVYHWPNGHPQYDVGHLDLLAEIDRLRAAHSGLYLTGSSYRGVGLPDCIHNGALVAEEVVRQAADLMGASARVSAPGS